MSKQTTTAKATSTTIKDTILLEILLTDNTTKKNILWATTNYQTKGIGYGEQNVIKPEMLKNIKPRTNKSKKELLARTKEKAEVFTPSWICNAQNNLIDNAWFGSANAFNRETEKGWKATKAKIKFPTKTGKTWQDYVNDTRLEITCGEAPYLTSRYDTVTGESIAIENRIGLIDRKLRVVSENAENEEQWYEWAKKAYQQTYGYDWQGDNVYLARVNLLNAFIETYQAKFQIPPIKEYLQEIATIISWNIWQMDGLRFVVPYSCKATTTTQISFMGQDSDQQTQCEGCRKNNPHKHNGTYCKIKDWQTNKTQKFESLTRGRKN